MNSTFPNLIVWLDLPVKNLDRAISFYSDVFLLTARDDRPLNNMASFQLSPAASGITLIQTDSDITNHTGATPYFQSTRPLDTAVARAKLNGGTILQEIHSMEPFGFRAVLLDSEGNKIALHGQPTKRESV